MSSNANLTMTKDLWSIAEKEVNKIKPDASITITNEIQNSLKRKSFDDVFKNANQTISVIMPKGSTAIKTSDRKVPESVRLLDTYAQRMGFLPLGEVYEKPGTLYVGRTEEITENGEKYYKSFPQLKESFFDTPNLTQNLSFRANNAIEKWNEFVTAEAELADFLEKAESEEGRKKLIYEYAKTSSITSDYLKILSSLYYHYFDHKSIHKNYLGIEERDIIELKKILTPTTTTPIEDVYSAVIALILSSKTKNQEIFEKISNYHEYKVQSLRASLNQTEFEIVKEMLDEQKAYVPNEMIQTPLVEQSEWYEILKKERGEGGLNNSKFIITNWNPNEKWFKAVNYLR